MKKKTSDIRILVIGDLMLDEYVFGKKYCISREAPVPILGVDEFKVNLGGAANVANNLSAMGCKVWLCGVIGESGTSLGHGYSASRFMKLVKESEIKSDYIIQSASCRTTTKTRVIINNQQVVRYDYEQDALDPRTKKIY